MEEYSDLPNESSDQFWDDQTTYIRYCKGEEECNSVNDFFGTEYDNLDALELHPDFDVDDINDSKIYYTIKSPTFEQSFDAFRDVSY